jgi:autotransporter-associated beta strand protein
VTGSSNVTLAGGMSGTGGLIMNGTDTLIVSANNSYSGGTTVSGGTLLIEHPNALGTGPLTITNTAKSQLQAGLTGPVQLSSLTIAGDATPTATLGVTDNNMVLDNGSLGTTDNATDYDLWSAGFAHQGSLLSDGNAIPAPADVHAVPEPNALLLAAVGMLIVCQLRKAQKSEINSIRLSPGSDTGMHCQNDCNGRNDCYTR